MRRFLMLNLLGCTLLAGAALAEPPAKAAPLKLDPAPMMRPVNMSYLPIIQEPICTESCNTTYDSIAFVRQKDNGVCVYQCSYHTTCTDSCSLSPFTTYGSLRVRSDPLPPNTCPTAALTFCDGFAID